MQILEPNTGEDNIFIPKDDVYVYITDYGKLALLVEIETGTVLSKYYWFDLTRNRKINISQVSRECDTFETAINRAINNMYCTVYRFQNFGEVVIEWNKIRYIDNIKTIYKQKEVSN